MKRKYRVTVWNRHRPYRDSKGRTRLEKTTIEIRADTADEARRITRHEYGKVVKVKWLKRG